MSRYDIAIIGMGCVFPKANDVPRYWRNIESGESFFEPMPDRLWHMRNFVSEDRRRTDKSYTDVGSFIDPDIDFPFLEFRLPPNTMKGSDPAQIVTLESVRQALADAGIPACSEQLTDAVTIIGASGVDQFAHSTIALRRHNYLRVLRPLLEARGVSAKHVDELARELEAELARRGHAWYPSIAAVGAITSSLSNRVAQVFGVRGFNMTVDGACASSFVSLNIACHALMSGDARLAIAGGTDLGTNPAVYAGFSAVDGLSKKGMSDPFDHRADGLVIGEGAGIAILKRLEDALADGDRIRAVIRGIGTSSDGAGQAIYAPSMEGRAEALRAALQVADISPHEVQYVEAHATSTVVGDANEYDAIATVYGPGRDPRNPLTLGSVKGQIGHLKAAAGMAGLIKTVLAMEHETLPHMPRFEKLTPHATKATDALVVPTKPGPWRPRPSGMRVAAVTSSGFGGVNYHVIVEQGGKHRPPPPRPAVPREAAIVGIACRVAGADSAEKFWENQERGRDLFVPVDPVELGWREHYDTGPAGERITTRMVSRIEPYKFNLLRHKIFPNAVSQIAPTQLLAVDLADKLLTDAGFELAARKNVGASIGAMHDDNFPRIFMPMITEEFADSALACPVAAKIGKKLLAECAEEAGKRIKEQGPPPTEHTLPGWMTNVIAGRVANRLNLSGPNFTVDTACSSGIGALLPAMYELMFGRVGMMIAGGLNQQLSDAFTCGVCALGAVAEREAKPYDVEGKGFLIGEGGVFFLLKRLADAVRDGDTIHAVIRAVGGSSEADSKSMVAPTEEAVRRAIRTTVEKSGVRPEEIALSDTHGSANEMSDIVEARSLAAELRHAGGAEPLRIIATKSHIGHLYGGSGASSVLSTLLALREGKAPGIRKLRSVRPEIAAIGGSVRPVGRTESLPAGSAAGGVNSLGLGGANYFAVLTAPGYGADKEQDRRPGAALVPPSRGGSVRASDAGRDDVFLCLASSEREIGAALGRALGQDPIPQVITEGAEIAARMAVTFDGQKALRAKLSSAIKMLDAGNVKPLESQGVFLAAASPEDERRLAFCFPGQGTHYIGMGRVFYDGVPVFRETVDLVHDLAAKAFGFDLKGHIYGDPEDERLQKELGTLVGAQTALFAAELATARMLIEKEGIRPDVMIGHSFGEISALTVAGTWDLETAYEVVKARIRAAETIRGSGGPELGMMSLICADAQRDAILALVGDRVVLTNINAPGRFVLSGERDAVKRCVAVAESFGAEARLLPIGAAFHSRFMEPARAPFREALGRLPCRPPRIPILSTITGEYVTPEGLTSASLAEHLSKQLVTQLNLPREIERLYGEGYRHFLEVGPGWSMTKMIDAILEGREHRVAPTLHPKVGDEETFRRARAFLMALGHTRSAAARHDVPGIFSADFVDYIRATEPAIISLLEEAHRRFLAGVRGQHLPERSGTGESGTGETAGTGGKPEPQAPAQSHLSPVSPVSHASSSHASDCRLFTSVSVPLGAEAARPFACRRVLSIEAEGDAISAGVKKRLVKRGVEVESIAVGALAEMTASLAAERIGACDTVLYLAHAPSVSVAAEGRALRETASAEIAKLYAFARTFVPALGSTARRVIFPVAMDGAFGVSPAVERPLGAFPAGFARCLQRELPACRVQIIDAGEIGFAQAVEANLDVSFDRLEVGMSVDGRTALKVAALLPPTVAGQPVGKGDLVLVTGGARGIVFECVLELARRTGCRLLLTGRTELPMGRPAWLGTPPAQIDAVIREMEIRLVKEEGKKLPEAKRIGALARAQWELSRNLDAMEAAGIEGRYERCDVSDAKAFAALLRQLRAGREIVRGVVHGAGIQKSKLVTELTDEAIAATARTKLDPVFTMLDALDWSQVRLFSSFGSIAGLFGNAGQSDYGLANDMLAWLTTEIGALHRHVKAQTVEWTAWTGAGMVTEEEGKRFAEVGLTPLDVRTGVRLYADAVLGSSHARVAAFNAGAPFANVRPVSAFPVPARPRERLLDEGAPEGGTPRARFSLEGDPYVRQHLVRLEPVIPGTFVAELLAEATAGAGRVPIDVQFRRPLGVREGGTAVEVVRDGDSLYVVPENRPALRGKALANLSFSSCRLGEPGAPRIDDLKIGKRDLAALHEEGAAGGAGFYGLLDAKFSGALKTGPVFRGIRATREKDGMFFASAVLTDDALAAIAIPGAFAFNPVLADMAVQAAAAFAMLRFDVMEIPFGIGALHALGPTQDRRSVIICRAREMSAERTVVDLVVREPGGRPVLAMDGLVLKLIEAAGG